MFVGLLVALPSLAVPPIGQELRPSVFGFPYEDDISQRSKIVLLDGDPRTSHDRIDIALLQLGQNFTHALTLHDHSADANDVGTGAAIEIDRLDILVDERDPVFRWSERGQQR